jgi:hypothetical protein
VSFSDHGTQSDLHVLKILNDLAKPPVHYLVYSVTDKTADTVLLMKHVVPDCSLRDIQFAETEYKLRFAVELFAGFRVVAAYKMVHIRHVRLGHTFQVALRVALHFGCHKKVLNPGRRLLLRCSICTQQSRSSPISLFLLKCEDLSFLR